MGFYFKQFVKMCMQHIILPVYYLLCCRKPIIKKRVVFADAHKSQCPLSMRKLHTELERQGYDVVDDFFDLQACTAKEGFLHMLFFMRLYAQAQFVILQDNFLPVSSCRKRRGTKVIQLWHGCGAFKKFGYDSKDDIPKYYKGNVYKNYDVVTVSSPFCRPFFMSAMRVKYPKAVRAYGSSYTDCYYDADYAAAMRQRFTEVYGETMKKVIVWAPTFRGNAGQQDKAREGLLPGEAAIDRLAQNPNYMVIKSLHPHMLKVGETQPLSTGELLFSADILITDYSSILFEYLLLDRPMVLFAPDLSEYKRMRGWYLSYEELPGVVVTEEAELETAVEEAVSRDAYEKKRASFRKKYMSRCDGKATTRLLEYMQAEAGNRDRGDREEHVETPI